MPEKNNIEFQRNPQILLVPLDWGLGHATRCVPIIRHLRAKGCNVIIAGEGASLALLKGEFPSIQTVFLKGYRLQYSTNRWKTIVKIGLQLHQIISAIKYEHRWLKQFSNQERIDGVISDNRYGLFLSSVPSVFITHQLTIKTPFGRLFDSLLRKLNYFFIKRFQECWVPDSANDNSLAGELSHPPFLPGIPTQYLNPLSRFHTSGDSEIPAHNDFILVLISGPEPQRSIFEALILKQVTNEKLILVRGLPGESIPPIYSGENVIIHNHLPGEKLAALVSAATLVISRSGYTSVMELLLAGKNCLFVPTPGQTEQEYLAQYLAGKKYCLSVKQSRFFLKTELQRAQSFPFERLSIRPGPNGGVLDAFIERIKGGK